MKRQGDGAGFTSYLNQRRDARPEPYATRYLSRHSGEQKCTTLPFTVRVTLVSAET